jgi:glycosyltransferase involved in cell wall biosynthesis
MGGKCKVLFIVPSLRRGGAETQALDLVNGLDAQRIEKHLLVLDPEIDQISRLDESSVKFHHLSRSRRFDIGTVKAIARLIDRYDIGVIHCTLQISLFYGWLATRVAKKNPRLMVAIHTTVNASFREEFFDRLLYRNLIRQCERVIFVCRAQAEYWKEKYPEMMDKSLVIYNGVDPEYFRREPFLEQGAELRRSLSIPDNAGVIVCIAGFRREKGHRYLVEAFSRLDGSPHLILAGDGVCRDEIESMVNSDRKLSQRVHFLGNVSDVRPVLAASDLSVLASTAVETFSIAMLESMSMQVPVVATDIGGLREAIEQGVNGDIVKVADVDSLKKGLSHIAEGAERLTGMGRNARVRIKERFSQKMMIDNTEAVLCVNGID